MITKDMKEVFLVATVTSSAHEEDDFVVASLSNMADG
jgi:hypothetical protein